MNYKQTFSLLVIAFASAFAVAQQPGPASLPCGQLASLQVNWSQFHFDPCHTGFNPYEKVLSPSTVRNLVVDWQYNISSNHDMYSSPAVVNGILYVGSVPGVYALDASTGALIWKYTTNCGYSNESSPAVVNGIVYIGCGIYDNLTALDAQTGKLLWSFPTGSGNDVSGSPTVANGTVYFKAGEIFAGSPAVYALDAKTGEYRWQVRIGAPGAYDTPAVGDGRVYVPGGYPEKDGLYALDAITGDLVWQFGNGTDCSPAAVTSGATLNRVVYVACGWPDLNTVYGLNASLGTVIWQRTVAGGVLASPAIANGAVYVASQEYGLYALDAKTGDVLWTAYQVGSAPVVANGVLYVGSPDFSVYGLNASSGALLWNYKTGKYVYSTPTVANGKLYVGSDDGNVYAFHLPN